MKKRSKSQGFINNPFTLQKDRLPDAKPPEPAKKPSHDSIAARSRFTPLSDEELFAQAMQDVVPIEAVYPELPTLPPPKPIRDDDQEALRILEELVYGKQQFIIELSGEFVEGNIQGLDPRILRRLKVGEYSWQAYLDLHGMRVEEAKLTLQRFIERQRRKGHRCLLIVHGRGHHSIDREPILKQRIIRWLTHGFLHKQILAFCSAQSHDGGVGALYLLLRKHPHS